MEAQIYRRGLPFFVVFDLDGTLALGAHREHFLARQPKDWDSWHAACTADAPCKPVVAALWAHMLAGHRVEIWTGRSDKVRVETVAWFDLFGVPSAMLMRMRPAGDHQPDVDLKRAWLYEARKNGGAPVLVYDDRDRVVEMWRSEGVTCFQVAPGAY